MTTRPESELTDGSLAPPEQGPRVLWHPDRAAVLGVAITLSPIDPIKALTAVINGVVAVPVMA
jgi:hypothetical protein